MRPYVNILDNRLRSASGKRQVCVESAKVSQALPEIQEQSY